MNYTENYHLPQWDETDRIMRTDFNRMCADMENGLLKTARDASANTAAASANAAQASQRAQSTADKAVQDAAKAQAKADAAYSPSQPPYVVGTYKPSGTEMTVDVGFRPSFLMVTGGMQAAFCGFTGPNMSGEHLTITNTGFKVKCVYANTTPPIEREPFLMQNGIYTYIAFR